MESTKTNIPNENATKAITKLKFLNNNILKKYCDGKYIIKANSI